MSQHVTEPSQAAVQEHSLELDFRRLVDNATQGIVVVHNGKAVYHNHALRELGRHHSAAPSSLRLFDVVHPDDRAEISARYEAVLSGQGRLGLMCSARWMRLARSAGIGATPRASCGAQNLLW